MFYVSFTKKKSSLIEEALKDDNAHANQWFHTSGKLELEELKRLYEVWSFKNLTNIKDYIESC